MLMFFIGLSTGLFAVLVYNAVVRRLPNEMRQIQLEANALLGERNRISRHIGTQLEGIYASMSNFNLDAPAVRAFMIEHNIPLFDPDSFKDLTILEQIQALADRSIPAKEAKDSMRHVWEARVLEVVRAELKKQEKK